MSDLFSSLAAKLSKYAESVGRFQLFLFHVLKVMFTKPFRFSLVMQHIQNFGVESVFIILLTAFFTGSVFGLQIGYVFSIFALKA